MPGHSSVLASGGGVLSNAHKGALRATQKNHMREGFVPTGLKFRRSAEERRER